jgi:hypothetical protein
MDDSTRTAHHLAAEHQRIGLLPVYMKLGALNGAMISSVVPLLSFH